MSKRKDKRRFRTSQEKTLRAKDRERLRLYKAKWNLGWIVLDKPIPNGYEKVLVVRSDLLKTKHSKYLQELCDLITTSVHCADKSFITKDWRTRKKVELHPKPRELREDEFERLPEHYKKEFAREKYTVTHWGSFSRDIYVYKVKKAWRFVEKVQKHYITKVRICDPLLESRIAEIENWFDTNNYWSKLDHLYGRRRSAWYKIENMHKMSKEKRFIESEIKREVLEYSLNKHMEQLT